MNESSVVTIDQINDLIEQMDANTKTLKRQYDDMFIKYTSILSANEYYKKQLKTMNMNSRGLTAIEYEDLDFDGNKDVPGISALVGMNATITTTDDILYGAERLNLVVLENEPGKFTNVRRDSNNSYIISHYTNEKSSIIVPLKITNPFDFNIFSLETKSQNSIIVRIGSTQYEANTILFPSLINEHEITIFVEFNSDLFLENTTNEYGSYSYIQTVKIDKIITGNISTEANFSTIQKIDKYAQDYIVRSIKINDGYNFGNDFYSSMLVEFARNKENAKNGIFFKSVIVPASGSVNEVINEYAGTAEQWVRVSISDNVKPIIIKNIKIQYSVR